MSLWRRLIGEKGERLARQALRRSGYRVVAKNWRCPLGELDVVALEGGTLVFIEVRTRSTREFGPPAESVTPKKQAKVRRLAEYYLMEESNPDIGVRFDVVAVDFTRPKNERIEIIRDAF